MSMGVLGQSASGSSSVIHSGSSSVIRLNDPERIIDVEQKHRLVADLLSNLGLDALLLQKPSNIAWFTSGGDARRGGSGEATAALLITRDARVVATANDDTARLFEQELPGLGFQLKERPWHEAKGTLIEDVCRGRNVASDTGIAGTRYLDEEIRRLRITLSACECERLRDLSRCVAHAVEATARNCPAGSTEADIAAEVAHRLIKREVLPVRIQVWADGRAQRFPLAPFGSEPIEQSCVISAVGRRWGLCAGASRTFCFGERPEALAVAHCRAMLIQATGFFFSQAGWELSQVWERVKRIYEKFGCPDEWQRSSVGELIAYEPNEVCLVPRSRFRLAARMALFWHPSVGEAVSGDTTLVGSDGFELLTPMEDWPRMTVDVKGHKIPRPEILRR